MKHYLKVFLFSSILSLFLFSCSKKDDPEPSSGNNSGGGTGPDPTFLKEGTEFNYVYSDFFSDGTVQSVVEEQIATDTFLVRNYSDISYINPTQYYVLKNGILYTSFRQRDPGTYYIACKFNQPVGTTWNVSENGTSYTYSIDGINQTFVTGQGTINDAVKVKIVNNSSSTTSYNYYSPSVGILGTGEYGSSEIMQLESYTIGTSTSSPASSYPPTFGTFPFLQVGKFWRYAQEDFVGDKDTLKVEIISQLPSNTNIYRVKLTTESINDISYEYWFEDHGLLMTYEEGETYVSADPIYMKQDVAQVGYGWSGRTLTGTNFMYKISDLNASATSTHFGTQTCMSIDVSSGFFSSQTNYWNTDKGQVYIDGLQTLDAINSNVKKAAIPHIPGFIF